MLYWSPTPATQVRASIRHHLRALDYSPSRHTVTYWNTYGPPRVLPRLGDYDAVILHTTLLCLRWSEILPEWRWGLRWIRDLDCIKIAFPQDEYDHSEILDEWLYDWSVGHIFSNFPRDQHRTLYPLMCTRASFHHAFTGYIDEDSAGRLVAASVDTADRPVDVVYRARHLPYWFGSHGQLKHVIGERALEEATRRGLTADISTRDEDTIVGDRWFDFIASGRSIVGAESGSSVLDRRGEIKATIKTFLKDRPNASFEETSAILPDGWDTYKFFAISPRHFEAVICKTAQILVRGRYDGVFVADRHYVPVAYDLSDLGDGLEKSQDVDLMRRITDCAYEEIYMSRLYTYRQLAGAIDQVLDTRPPRRRTLRTLAVSVARAQGLQEMGDSARR